MEESSENEVRATMEDFTASPFDAIRRVNEQGREYWDARDLGKLLGYAKYANFTKAIRKAEKACEESGEAIANHIPHVRNMIPVGKGAQRPSDTIHLSRYACYLVIENSDPDGKPIVAAPCLNFSLRRKRALNSWREKSKSVWRRGHKWNSHLVS